LGLSSKDGTFSFHDLKSRQLILRITEFKDQIKFNNLQFHPDGHLLALAASDGSVKIWNTAENSLAASLPNETEGET